MTAKEIEAFVDDLHKRVEEKWKQQMRGTPKTLLAAIQNGQDHYSEDEAVGVLNGTPDDYIKRHVIDFLAQKFQIYMLGNSDVVDTAMESLWERIIKND